MKMETNTIIASGLVVMGVIAVSGWVLISFKTGTSTGTEIPIGIISGLTGVLTGKKLAEYEYQQNGQQSQVSHTLGQVAQTAKQAQDIANAVDGSKETFKKKEENS